MATPVVDEVADNCSTVRRDAPGSARYGNFINYYTFNPAGRRIKLIPAPLVEKLLTSLLSADPSQMVALDIGCNAGDLTCALFDLFKRNSHTLHMLGVDIDSELIERSREANTSPESITFKVADVMDAEHVTRIDDYLTQKGASRFDVTFCFSVTLWIHLNHGDDGLKRFLKRLAASSRWILIEPQPWKCYKNAIRRMKKLACRTYDHFATLMWRETVETDIERFLVTECGCVLEERLGTTAWDRNICLFKTS